MSLTYHSTYVQAPSAAPLTDNSGTDYLVRHRRVSSIGHTLWSDEVATNLPATITPQTYTGLGRIRDEFVISEDNGATWKIVPRGTEVGPQLISSYSSSWATTNDANTQLATLPSLDLGSFSDTESPSATLFVVNRGPAVNDIKVNFIDLLLNKIATSYMGLIQVTVDGVYSPAGSGPSSLYNQSFVWASPQVSLNTLQMVLPTDAYFRLQISFINFPAPQLSSSSINLGLELVANQKTSFLGFGSDWLVGSYHVDQGNFVANFLSATDVTNVTVGPYLVNVNGVLHTNFGSQSFTVAGVGTNYKLALVNGTPNIYTGAIPGNALLLATFDIEADAPHIANIEWAIDIKPATFSKANGTVAAHRFVMIDSTGELALADISSAVVGVSLLQPGHYATSGLIRIELGGTVSVGQRIGPTTDGLGINSSSGFLVALESGEAGDIVVAVSALGSLPGPQGEPGEQGEPGPQGPQGEPGPAGPDAIVCRGGFESGTGTPTLSGTVVNVASLTRLSVGTYQVTFSTPVAGNYQPLVTTNNPQVQVPVAEKSSTGFTFVTRNPSGSKADTNGGWFVVFN